MKLTAYQKDVMSAKICPYCKSKTKTVPQKVIYGKTYNKKRYIICCVNWPHCDSYVGTDDEGITLGRLSSKVLRREKAKTHGCVDRIWKEKHLERYEVYEEMSDHFRIPEKYTHIGMFGVLTCKQVQSWAIKMYNQLK